MKLAWCALVGAVGVGSAAAQEAGEIEFNWQVPCAATVTETVEAEGARGASRQVVEYRITVTRLRGTEDARCARRDYRLLELDELPLEEQQHSALRAQIESAGLNRPDLRIEPDGSVAGAVDWTEHLRRIAEGLEALESQGLSPQRANYVLRQLSQRSIQQRLTLQAEDVWGSWIGDVLGLAAQEGEQTGRFVRNLGPRTLETSLEAVLRRDVGRWEIRTTARDETDALRAELEEQLPDDAPPLVSVARVWTTSAVLEPRTYRPQEVTVTKTLILEVEGEAEPITQSERHHYVFAWE